MKQLEHDDLETATTPHATLGAQMEAVLPSPAAAGQPLSQGVRALSRLLSRTPKSEPASAEELTQALDSREPLCPEHIVQKAAGCSVVTVVPLSVELQPTYVELLLQLLPLLRHDGLTHLAVGLPHAHSRRLRRALDLGMTEKIGVELALAGHATAAQNGYPALIELAHRLGLTLTTVDRESGYRDAYQAGRLTKLLKEHPSARVFYLPLPARREEQLSIPGSALQQLCDRLDDLKVYLAGTVSERQLGQALERVLKAPAERNLRGILPCTASSALCRLPLLRPTEAPWQELLVL